MQQEPRLHYLMCFIFHNMQVHVLDVCMKHTVRISRLLWAANNITNVRLRKHFCTQQYLATCVNSPLGVLKAFSSRKTCGKMLHTLQLVIKTYCHSIAQLLINHPWYDTTKSFVQFQCSTCSNWPCGVQDTKRSKTKSKRSLRHHKTRS